MSDMPKALRVLVIGGSGVFGSRLAQMAAQEPGVSLTLAGRNLDRLEQAANAMVPPPSVLRLDRDAIEPRDLEPFDLVIDAAGPFQASKPYVIAAALGSGTPYVDLADGRRFVADFPSFDDAAKRCGVPLITGASSIPALSHAVLDRMVSSWSAVEDIRIGIFPGNRAPRGLSVVQAILSYVGKPVKVFRQGEWQEVPGWGLTHSERIPGIGKRWASVCDTPEQDLLVQRYRPRRSAEFFAGLELGLLHHGLAMLSIPVRKGWIDSLRPFSKAMLAAAKLFLPFGSDKGAMIVSASGEDHMGRPVDARWSLAANGNRGPFVPVLAALCMIRRFRDGWPPEAGAHVCAGLLGLNEFEEDMARLGIVHRFEETHGRPADVLTEGAKAA